MKLNHLPSFASSLSKCFHWALYQMDTLDILKNLGIIPSRVPGLGIDEIFKMFLQDIQSKMSNKI